MSGWRVSRGGESQARNNPARLRWGGSRRHWDRCRVSSGNEASQLCLKNQDCMQLKEEDPGQLHSS